MTNNNRLLIDEELDLVTGGGHGCILVEKLDNGKYNVTAYNFKTDQGLQNLLNGGKADLVDISGNIVRNKGVPAERLDALLEKRKNLFGNDTVIKYI